MSRKRNIKTWVRLVPRSGRVIIHLRDPRHQGRDSQALKFLSTLKASSWKSFQHDEDSGIHRRPWVGERWRKLKAKRKRSRRSAKRRGRVAKKP